MNARKLFIKNSILQGPQGLQGVQGPQGIQGATGPAGVSILAYNTANSATLTNFTAATAFNLTYNVPANYFTVGKILRVRWGVSLVPGAAQNITLNPRIGGQGIANPAFAVTAQNYEAEVELYLICRSIGAAGVLQPGTKWLYMAEAGTGAQPYAFPATGTYTIDTTSAQTIDLQVTSTVANNTAVVRAFTVESLN